MCWTKAGSWKRERTASCWPRAATMRVCARPRPTTKTASPKKQQRHHTKAMETAPWPSREKSMTKDLILDLAECTEFRQTLQARPPGIVHGTAILLVTLLGTALAWAALTQADLVVRAPGRVRPVTTPGKVFNASRAEVLSASSGGRVLAVNFREGDEVKEGDVLLRLDTEHINNEIVKHQRTSRTGEEELARIIHLEKLLSHQWEAARAKALADLGQTQEEVRQAKERRAVEIRLARVELASALDDAGRVRRLVPQMAVSATDFVKAT